MKYEQHEAQLSMPGSWMPVDIDPHWQWYNPLNLLIVLPPLILMLGWVATL